jgi:hypothetical protein
MFRTAILVIMVSLTTIASAQAMNQVNTLGANDAISNEMIEGQVDEGTAGVLLETPYKGFYQIKSKVKNSKITFSRIVSKQSFPDDRWTDMAKDIASLVELPAYSTGSRITPKATAYVVFYDVNLSGLDRSKVMTLPTTADAEPNMLVVLVIKHQNHSRTQGILGIQKSSADQNGNSIYFFELAM